MSSAVVSGSPVAALPHKTLFHELGHVLLGHTAPECSVARHVQELEAESVAILCLDALDLPGSEYARGYVQHWATSDDLTDEVESRILRATDTILRAGLRRRTLRCFALLHDALFCRFRGPCWCR